MKTLTSIKHSAHCTECEEMILALEKERDEWKAEVMRIREHGLSKENERLKAALDEIDANIGDSQRRDVPIIRAIIKKVLY